MTAPGRIISRKLEFIRHVSKGLLAPIIMFLCSCTSTPPEVFFKEGKREELKVKAIRVCHGDFRVLEEHRFGPFIRARLLCLKRNHS